MIPAKFPFLLLAAAPWCALPVRAQTPAISEPPRHPIAAAKAVPAFVTRVMPQESRSLFWGVVPHQPGGKTIGLHLYALIPEELRRAGKCHLVLDVFQVPPAPALTPPHSPLKRSRKRKPPLFNRALFSTVFSAPPTTFDMAFTWLDLAHAEPVLIIRSFAAGSSGLTGSAPSGSAPSGIEHFVTFPHGWKNSASVCNLRFGTGDAANPERETNRLFMSQNEPPTLEATLAPLSATPAQPTQGEEPMQNRSFVLRWDEAAEAFRPVAGQQTLTQRYFRPLQ